MNKKYHITVEDSLLGEKVIVEIEDKAIYDVCRRSGWKTENNNRKHAYKELPFSSLIGGEDGVFEHFYEFISIYNDPCEIYIRQDFIERLNSLIKLLTKKDRLLIEELFFNEKTERQLAVQLGVNRNAIHKRKCRLLEKLKNLLEN